MNLSLPKTYFKFLFIVMLFIGQQVIGQVNMSSTGSHTQDFNTLSSTTAATPPWVNNSTITNWYAQRTGTGTTYAVGTGSANAGNLYSFGSTSASDRALGSIGSGNAAAGSFAYGVLLRNTSGVTLTDLKVTYTLEQWRRENNATAHTITFWYKVSSSVITNLNPNSNETWTQVTALTTTSPVTSATTGAALNGNLAANKVTLSNISIPSLSLTNNDYIMLKWDDPDQSGSDHGLAIDDVTINWTVTPAGPTVTTTAATAISTTGADLNGTINANGTTTDASFEYGTTAAYGFSATATPSSATGTTATSITATIGSLALNTQYHFRAVGIESATVYNGSDLTFYTLAATPGALAVNNEQLSTLDVTVNSSTENGNPSTTQYAIQETGGQYVQANGSLGATAVWQTAATWATTTVTGLTASTTYTFQVKARNGANVETSFGTTNSGTTLSPITADYNVVQSPNTTQNITEGTSFTVYIRAYEDGITNLAGSSPRLKGWVGYSSTNDNPANVGWTWIPATFNVQVGNDDEYEATIPGSLSPGTYYYAARFEIDDSMVYTYGGAGGNWNNNNVTLNVNADVVDFANIQFPTTATITEGETVTVFAQVYEPGVTEGAGQGAGITAEIGYSSTDTAPNGTWIWLATTHNTSVTGNNDEYQVNLGTGLAPGTYYYASRFIKTGSSTYVYGGTTGNWNNNSGVLTVNELEAPVATEATLIGQTEFTANWETVEGASGYRLDVSTSPMFEENNSGSMSENFENGLPTGSYITTPTATDLNSGSWTLSNVLRATIMNSGSYSMQLRSPTTNGIAISPSNENVTNVTFFARRGGSGGGTIPMEVYKVVSGIETLVSTINLTINYQQFNIPIDQLGSDVRIKLRNTGGNVAYIDDLVINFGTITPLYVSGYENLNVGNVTSYQVTGLDPNTTYYYRVRAINNSITTSNSNVIEVETRPSVVTWNGTEWSNIAGPDETIDAIIDGAYVTGTHGEFTSKKLTVTSGSLTVSTGTSITVEDVLENELSAAAIVVENNANLIQSNDVDNIGSITVERNSSDVMRLDYTLWSSPVAGQNLLAFSPQTMANRFYVYNPSNNQYATIAPSTNSFAEGTGYLIRSPDNHSTTAADWAGTFVGEPHNGDVTISVSNGTYNAVGNPYPSTISANAFITANGLTEALYFWRKTNGAAGSAYATYTFAGGAGTGSSDSDAQVPNGTIQVGQGFLVKATSGSLVFTNLMRTANHQNQFFRNADSDKNRIWLNVSNAQNVIGQTLLAYMENTSVEYDAMYDGKYINDSQTAFTSLLNNEEFAVQARGLFTASDVVPMHFKTEAAGSYTISLANVDGLFETEQDIFVKDNFTGVEHNLKNTAYEFTSVEGSFGDRFEIIYQSTLSVSVPEFANQTIVFAKDNNLNVQSGSVNITGIQVFDVQGRLVLDVKEINSVTYSTSLDQISNGVLLVKVTAENGQSTTKKIIK